ncbi:MAG TPA: trehalose-phosphatase [Rhodocyclaceae bacterium]|nr:trehalose-phosphatase [Rhodocyclaceae bacterium]
MEQNLEAVPLPRCREAAWFLDIDGTLIDIAATPGDVCVAKVLPPLLTQLHTASDGALALVTGRTVASADHLFAPLQFAIAGQHGLERRDANGTMHLHASDARKIAAARPTVVEWTDRHPELLLEDKGLSLAIHFRQAPVLGDAVRDFLAGIVASTQPDLHLQAGKMVYELRPAGRDKGVAVREYLAETPFAGRTPVFVGDDLTDEFGFVAINQLHGLTVKVGEEWSSAQWRLPDVGSVLRWLTDCVAQDFL